MAIGIVLGVLGTLFIEMAAIIIYAVKKARDKK